MTVNTDISTASYTGNGSTVTFAVPFYFLVDTDLQVSKLTVSGVSSILVLNSEYTLTGAGAEVGGTLTTPSPLAVGDKIFIERNVDAIQQTEYPVNGPFPAASHERALDRLTMLAQQCLSKLTFGLFRSPLGNTFDLGMGTLTNGGTAVNANDVPNLQQVQGLIVGGAAPALAGPSGASFIGMKRTDVANAVQSVISAWLNAETINPVRDFGFDSTGTNDNAAPLAVMLASLQLSANGRGRRIRFPSGTFKFSTTMAFTAYAVGQVHNMVIEGDGPANTILDFSLCAAGTDGVTFNAGAHFVVRDLNIRGATRDGLVIGLGNTVNGANYCNMFEINNVRIQNSGRDGLTSTNSFMGSIRNCWLFGNAGNGVALRGFHTSMHVDRCWAQNNTLANWTINGCVYSTFSACGSDGAGTYGWALSNLRGVAFVACGAESNARDGFLFLSADVLAAGLPLSAQDIHGVSLVSCYALNNSVSAAGSFATFMAALTANGRPIEVKIVGGSATPATTSDAAFVLNGASGAVSESHDQFHYDGFTAADVVAGTVARNNRGVAGQRAIAQLGAAQSVPSGTPTLVTWSGTLPTNDFGATVVSSGIIIPKYVNKVRVTCNLDFAANATGVRQLIVQKNSANALGIPTVTVPAASAGDTDVNASSAVISVVAGDSITVNAFQNSGGALNLTNGAVCWLSVEAVA